MSRRRSCDKILPREALMAKLESLRREGKRIVFTNGCFDLVHLGHQRYLREAKALGEILVVALNSDASAMRVKAEERPILPEQQRARILASFESVDYVTIFDEDTPIPLLKMLQPDILVKGGDYTIEGVVGREEVWSWGGEVRTVGKVDGVSSTRIIETILSRFARD